MKILILDGSPRGGSVPGGAAALSAGEVRPDGTKDRASPRSLGALLDGLEKGLRARGQETRRLALRDLEIGFCTGCWTCWWGTPGSCAIRDDMELVYPAFVEADLVVWAAPLVLGTVPALVKKCQDRMIPLIHPYIELVEGECHHRRRYARYPALGLIVEPDRADGPEDLAICRRLHERLALNFRSSLRFFATTADPTEELLDAAIGA